jgi:hypothetical protein
MNPSIQEKTGNRVNEPKYIKVVAVKDPSQPNGIRYVSYFLHLEEIENKKKGSQDGYFEGCTFISLESGLPYRTLFELEKAIENGTDIPEM